MCCAWWLFIIFLSTTYFEKWNTSGSKSVQVGLCVQVYKCTQNPTLQSGKKYWAYFRNLFESYLSLLSSESQRDSQVFQLPSEMPDSPESKTYSNIDRSS